jgi:hypothetical protein
MDLNYHVDQKNGQVEETNGNHCGSIWIKLHSNGFGQADAPAGTNSIQIGARHAARLGEL